MEEKTNTGRVYPCFQPAYFRTFRCDPTMCRSKCCKKWKVDIDGATYQRYCAIEPKDARRRIVKEIKYEPAAKQFVVKLLPNGDCPFLTEEGLCHIQKTHGEKLLSATCTTYPRVIYQAGDLFERALSLTCPEAAWLALLPKEPMAFEMTEDTIEGYKLLTGLDRREAALVRTLPSIQWGGISILQNRSLTIDQRLIVLGFYLDQAGDLAARGALDRLPALAEVYAADDFMREVPAMLAAIEFRPKEYVRSMFGLMEALYGEKSTFTGLEQNFTQCVVKAFGVEEKRASVAALARVYEEKFRPAAERLLEAYGHIFENYLVNEFFINRYPLWIAGSFVQNYVVFAMMYKFVEFIAVSMAVSEEGGADEAKLLALIVHMTSRFDHSQRYLDDMTKDTLRRQKDVVQCMKSLLNRTLGAGGAPA